MLGAHFGEDLQALFTESLKAVRRSTGFVSASAKQPRARLFDPLGNGQTLFLGFHGARAGNQGHMLSANDDVARGRGNAQDGVFFLGVTADQLVRLADGDTFHDPGQRFENAKINLALVSGNANGGSQGAGNGVGFEAEALDALANGANLLLGGMRLHDDQHERFSPRRSPQELKSTATRRKPANPAVALSRLISWA
jgi:hypothetical protein